MVNYLLAVDSDPSTDRALNKLLDDFDPQVDKLFMVAVTSNWDYVNEEKNASKLALYKLENYCDVNNIQCRTLQIAVSNIVDEYVNIVKDFEINSLFIGRTAFVNTVSQDDFLFRAFSYVRRLIQGSIVDNLVAKAGCKVVVVD
eukprot:TRINITY_DN833_c0_g1_i2.p1 TRINITY_DN833_c0_g1~~TRINITY_DN833_c0_g1_i2.p1  ORF type:complete len:144 (-),score=25.34 TRINITY_DN833_c0_g1_i2:130-561(-)